MSHESSHKLNRGKHCEDYYLDGKRPDRSIGCQFTTVVVVMVMQPGVRVVIVVFHKSD